MFQISPNPIQRPAHNYVELRTTGVEEQDPFEIVSKTAPAARRKAIGSWIDPSPLVPLTASQGSPEPRRQDPENPLPDLPIRPWPPGDLFGRTKNSANLWVPALSARHAWQ
jgi:hypothetical protein